ncbi:hypothetical protein PUN28_005201 [Cardiocondyla obscurior]|uniref:Uncharacterized protein n=1 Tax=Cardiocondyla obscurior TaxID=286306 RepID=A0AAW2GJK6_9HYME
MKKEMSCPLNSYNNTKPEYNVLQLSLSINVACNERVRNIRKKKNASCRAKMSDCNEITLNRSQSMNSKYPYTRATILGGKKKKIIFYFNFFSGLVCTCEGEILLVEERSSVSFTERVQPYSSVLGPL